MSSFFLFVGLLARPRKDPGRHWDLAIASGGNRFCPHYKCVLLAAHPARLSAGYGSKATAQGESSLVAGPAMVDKGDGEPDLVMSARLNSTTAFLPSLGTHRLPERSKVTPPGELIAAAEMTTLGRTGLCSTRRVGRTQKRDRGRPRRPPFGYLGLANSATC